VFGLPQGARGWQWGNWSANAQLFYAAAWPLTWTITIVVPAIALVFGVLFQPLFEQGDQDNK
jgi:hypothetical protein